MLLLFPRNLLLIVFVFMSFAVFAAGPDPSYKWIKGKSFVQSKNYYLLTLLEEIPAVKRLLRTDSLFSKLTVDRRKAISQGLTSCGRESACYTDQLKFSSEEISMVGDHLSKL
jgi:hypothetical protein